MKVSQNSRICKKPECIAHRYSTLTGTHTYTVIRVHTQLQETNLGINGCIRNINNKPKKYTKHSLCFKTLEHLTESIVNNEPSKGPSQQIWKDFEKWKEQKWHKRWTSVSCEMQLKKTIIDRADTKGHLRTQHKAWKVGGVCHTEGQVRASGS